MKAMQPSEGPVAKQPAPQEPIQPNPAPIPARGTFQQLPTQGGQQSTKQAQATEVTTGAPVKVVRQSRQG
jgi:hypothetical protein